MRIRRSTRSACLLTLALAVMSPRRGDAEGDSEVKTFITSIHHLYGAMDYEHALIQLQLARQMPRGRAEEVVLTLYEGIIQYEMGQKTSATAAFRAALLLDTQALLPEKVAPKVEAHFEAVRRQLKEELAPPPPAEAVSVPRPSAQEPAPRVVAVSPAESPPPPPVVVERQCLPAPEQPADTGLAIQQMWRLMRLEAGLCAKGLLDDQAAQALRTFRERSEAAKFKYELLRLGLEINQFETQAGIELVPAPRVAEVSSPETPPVAIEPPCGPVPERPTEMALAVQQPWRLVNMEATLCARGLLNEQTTQALREFQQRSLKAATNYQRVRLGQEIDQFARNAGL